jgi:hypothetical protein
MEALRGSGVAADPLYRKGVGFVLSWIKEKRQIWQKISPGKLTFRVSFPGLALLFTALRQ